VAGVIRPGDAILVKASRAVGLEGIPALIEKHSRAW
jgi:UDP-N-acetylmuramyl pentapeptide synthase